MSIQSRVFLFIVGAEAIMKVVADAGAHISMNIYSTAVQHQSVQSIYQQTAVEISHTNVFSCISCDGSGSGKLGPQIFGGIYH